MELARLHLLRNMYLRHCLLPWQTALQPALNVTAALS